MPVKTWQEMKSMLQEKYMLPRSCLKLSNRIANLQKGQHVGDGICREVY